MKNSAIYFALAGINKASTTDDNRYFQNYNITHSSEWVMLSQISACVREITPRAQQEGYPDFRYSVHEK